jgi:hypothetical protein
MNMRFGSAVLLLPALSAMEVTAASAGEFAIVHQLNAVATVRPQPRT